MSAKQHDTVFLHYSLKFDDQNLMIDVVKKWRLLLIFWYLGAVFTDTSDDTKEITGRIATTKMKMLFP